MDYEEVLPDIILMPNVGSRALMWQETAGVKNDTPARFLFPMFTSMDMEDLMRENNCTLPLGNLPEDTGRLLE